MFFWLIASRMSAWHFAAESRFDYPSCPSPFTPRTRLPGGTAGSGSLQRSTVPYLGYLFEHKRAESLGRLWREPSPSRCGSSCDLGVLHHVMDMVVVVYANTCPTSRYGCTVIT